MRWTIRAMEALLTLAYSLDDDVPGWHEKGIRAWIQRVRCRMAGHPSGVVWYDAMGDEPDMHCMKCGDDLG